VRDKDFILAWSQAAPAENGVYRAKIAAATAWSKVPIEIDDYVTSGNDGDSGKLDYRKWQYKAGDNFELLKKRRGTGNRRGGSNRDLENQLTPDAHFARIYAFTYEGSYYELPRPVIFLVHGDGALVTQARKNPPISNPARAPRETDLIGLAAADFDFADELRVWSYDKADYTIRLDVDTGMFDDVLLEAALGGSQDGIEARGMNARGMNARGMNARGMNARGMNARGMNARGGGGSD
jgi:hypothetical protein